jgi:hypothetical protein
MRAVSWVAVALLLGAVAVVVGAEWPRLSQRFGVDDRRRRERARRKTRLRVVEPEEDDFAASVKRDLDSLPTIEEPRRRR